MTCHDCGNDAQPGRLLAIVGNERRAYCQKHGELRWRLGCEKEAGWLQSGKAPAYYTGPLAAE